MHDAAYDVDTGEMTRAPAGRLSEVPGLGAATELVTRVFPLGRGEATEDDGTLYVR